MRTQSDMHDEKRRSLLTKLSTFPNLEIEAHGIDASSARSWFCIRDRVSGRHFTVRVRRTADFLTGRFAALLTRFAAECDCHMQ